MKVKFDQLTDTVTSLTQKLTELTKQNKDLKLMISELRSCVKVEVDVLGRFQRCLGEGVSQWAGLAR